MTCLCLLLLTRLVALVGAPIAPVAIGFLVDVQDPLAQISVRLWMTALFLMALFCGVSRQLIRRTLKNRLSAPLGELVSRIRQAMNCAVLTFARSAEPFSHPHRTWFLFPANKTGTSPTVPQLAGAMPRLD